jgi:ABC-2 type transport system permease protein
MSSPLWIITRRELTAYFATPLAYVFLVVFLMLCGFVTFELGDFFNRNQADLVPFFSYHPWLYLFLVPAIAMRIWAEERRSGSVELLLTLPLTLRVIVVGKFLAAWLFIALALLLTFPLWITVNYLGNPDNGTIAATYIGSWLMAGAFLAVGCCISAATKNQVIAFVMTVTVCFLFVVIGMPQLVSSLGDVLPVAVVNIIVDLSLLEHFDAISRGVLDIRDWLFYLLFIVCWLMATEIVVEQKKAQ